MNSKVKQGYKQHRQSEARKNVLYTSLLGDMLNSLEDNSLMPAYKTYTETRPGNIKTGGGDIWRVHRVGAAPALSYVINKGKTTQLKYSK